MVSDLEAAHDRALMAFGLTSKQAAVLLSCEMKEARTPAELANIYQLEVSSITRMVERLERKGFLKRIPSREDRRQVILQVTARGKTALHQALPTVSQVASSAWKGVTERERVEFGRIVAKVMHNLNHTGPDHQ